jgi:hypothetical protein
MDFKFKLEVIQREEGTNNKPILNKYEWFISYILLPISMFCTIATIISMLLFFMGFIDINLKNMLLLLAITGFSLPFAAVADRLKERD